MANEIETAPEPAVSTLVGGIMDDARELLAEQLALVQAEIKNDIHRITLASVPLIIGGLILIIAATILAAAGALLLDHLFPAFPLWAGFAIVGGMFLAAGLILVLWGKSRFDSMRVPTEQILQGLKENIQWKTKK